MANQINVFEFMDKAIELSKYDTYITWYLDNPYEVNIYRRGHDKVTIDIEGWIKVDGCHMEAGKGNFKLTEMGWVYTVSNYDYFLYI